MEEHHFHTPLLVGERVKYEKKSKIVKDEIIVLLNFWS